MLQSKKYITLRTALALAVLSFWSGIPAARATLPLLPVLSWQPRSDWDNVKVNTKPLAYGDGIHDDTTALQNGLNYIAIGNYGSKTLYLPAGTYRISRTLMLKNVLGAAVIGQGRNTRIVWNGPAGKPMFISNGASYARYVGIVWDGAGLASVGIDHQAKTSYEEAILHKDESFLNFVDAGIRVGYSQIIPTSEMTFRNCSFQHCGTGAAFLSWNDYNNNFDGCEFQDNGIAINCVRGNVAVRDCHFERSRTEDIYLCSQLHSVRRCTSIGSKQFVLVPGSGDGCGATIEDCHIDSWTGSAGAMTFAMRGPTTIFDCSFTHPPDTKAPVRLTNYGGWTQLALVSNCTAPSSPSVYDPGPNAKVSDVPSGLRVANIRDPHQSFFRSTESGIPTMNLDVKVAFGAKGDGIHDDTSAIQNALAAARTGKAGAVVYFPAGNYLVSGTLPLIGANYSVEGSGHQTILSWKGSENGVVWSIQDPQSLSLKSMSFLTPLKTAVVRQTAAGAASSRMLFERLWSEASLLGPGDNLGGNGHLVKTQPYRGMEFDSLPSSATILLDDVTGMTHFTNCSRAVILGNFLLGAVQVDGAAYEKSGFLGMLAHNACANVCDIVVRDNQDFVGTNFYTEQTLHALRVSGDGATPGLPGHVTIQGSYTRTYDPTPITIDNFEGRVTYTGGSLLGPVKPHIQQTGGRSVDIVLLGNASVGELELTSESGAHFTMLQNLEFTEPTWTALTNIVPNLSAAATASQLLGSSLANMGAGSLAGPVLTGPLQLSGAAYNQIVQPQIAPAAAALDDFRLLGAVDLALNYP